jgi:hypothetical protein
VWMVVVGWCYVGWLVLLLRDRSRSGADVVGRPLAWGWTLTRAGIVGFAKGIVGFAKGDVSSHPVVLMDPSHSVVAG